MPQARIQKLGGSQSPTVDVEWDYYEQRLPPERLAIVRELYERMNGAIAERALS